MSFEEKATSRFEVEATTTGKEVPPDWWAFPAETGDQQEKWRAEGMWLSETGRKMCGETRGKELARDQMAMATALDKPEVTFANGMNTLKGACWDGSKVTPMPMSVCKETDPEQGPGDYIPKNWTTHPSPTSGNANHATD